MKQTYGILAGMLFGLAIGIAFAWAVKISEDREQAELGADLNAYRNAVIRGGDYE
jgi:NhaP-type Na+/H+ or K+/H+ antiporter